MLHVVMGLLRTIALHSTMGIDRRQFSLEGRPCSVVGVALLAVILKGQEFAVCSGVDV